MISAAIANGGKLMKPYLVSEEQAPNLSVLSHTEPQEQDQVMNSSQATLETQMMIDVVNQGTGTAAQIPGIQVAGKTGTAQTGNNMIHAWFVCFAPATQPKVAVAVMVENQPEGPEATGGRFAAPIAKAILQAALQGP